MAVVGIRELRTYLSRYIKRAKGGEEIIISDRGKEVAALVPISRERRLVTELQQAGLASWKGGKPGTRKRVRIKGSPISDTVLLDR